MKKFEFTGNHVFSGAELRKLLQPYTGREISGDELEEARVKVTELADGTWRVRWEDLERTVAPMTQDAWCAWLEQNVGSLDAGDLETTES